MLREGQHVDLRDELPDDLALGGVVVGEHERVEPDRELRREPSQVRRLVVPVDGERRDVVQTQTHLRVPFEDLADVRLVILRGDREDDAALLQLEHVLLERDEGLAEPVAAECDAIDPVVADDAAPEGVVEVEDEALAREAEARGDDRRRVPGQERNGLERDGLLRAQPVPVVEPSEPAEVGGDPVAVDDRDVVARGGRELAVEGVDHRLPRSRCRPCQVAERSLGPHDEGVLHDLGARLRRSGVPQRAPARNLVRDLHGGGVAVAARDLRRTLVNRDQDQLGRRRIQRAGRIEEVLLVLAVQALVELEVDAKAEGCEGQRGGELAGCVAAGQRESSRGARGRTRARR